MAKQGTEYELFVKDAYECLNSVDGLDNANIQHNVKLKGASGVYHQIDLYWTFELGGVSYKVAVECKDYKNRISKEKIAAFHDILVDIGNIIGIFASKMGYQSGAKQFADSYGIQLMEIRHPNDSDWKGRVRNIILDLRMRTISNVRSCTVLDQPKIISMGLSFPQKNKMIFSAGDYPHITFDKLIADGKEVNVTSGLSVSQLLKMLPTDKTGKDFIYTFQTTNGSIYLNGFDYPLRGIQFKYDVVESSEKTEINGDQVIKAIAKNSLKGTERTIDMFGNVRPRKQIPEDSSNEQ